jgi:hypothetical protein
VIVYYYTCILSIFWIACILKYYLGKVRQYCCGRRQVRETDTRPILLGLRGLREVLGTDDRQLLDRFGIEDFLVSQTMEENYGGMICARITLREVTGENHYIYAFNRTEQNRFWANLYNLKAHQKAVSGAILNKEEKLASDAYNRTVFGLTQVE